LGEYSDKGISGQYLRPNIHPIYQLARLIAFSDNIFAFALTLLILIFPFQALPRGPFFTQLLTLKDSFLAYFVSFYTVGLFWLAHHRYFRYILKFDTGLFLINLVLLLFIAILPFPTYLLGADGFSSIAAAFYAGMLSLMNVLYLLLWWYASSRHRLISPTLEQDVITDERLRRLLPLSMFVISIGLALINSFLAMAVWIAAGLLTHFVPLGRRKSSRKGDE
jgi:uncharacterized membrane protein